MSKTYQRLELVANVLVIIVAVLLGIVLVQKHLLSPASASPPAPPTPTVGSKISLPDTNWSDNSKTVLLVLQKGCRYCTDSAPFYKRLIEHVKGKNIKIVAALPQTREDAVSYLNELGLAGLEIKQAELPSLSVGGTPTLILVNNQGEISNFWVGQLTREKEAEVLEKL